MSKIWNLEDAFLKKIKNKYNLDNSFEKIYKFRKNHWDFILGTNDKQMRNFETILIYKKPGLATNVIKKIENF